MATINVRMNKLPSLPHTLNSVVEDAITKAVHDIEAHADPLTPVDTGNLKNSKHTEINGLSARLHWQAEYALYVHEGTRYQPATPFAADAVEKVQPSLEQALSELEGRL